MLNSPPSSSGDVDEWGRLPLPGIREGSELYSLLHWASEFSKALFTCGEDSHIRLSVELNIQVLDVQRNLSLLLVLHEGWLELTIWTVDNDLLWKAPVNPIVKTSSKPALQFQRTRLNEGWVAESLPSLPPLLQQVPVFRGRGIPDSSPVLCQSKLHGSYSTPVPTVMHLELELISNHVLNWVFEIFNCPKPL